MTFSLIIIFLLLSALFSGTEIAFISASKLLVKLKKKKGSRRGRIIADFFEKPSEFLGTMLLGNNIALVIFSILMTEALNPFFENSLHIHNEFGLLFLTTLIITLVVLVFGEFLPKTLFRLYADDILYFLAYPLRAIKWFLTVPTWITTKLSNTLLRVVFRTPIEAEEEPFTRLDLENFIKSSSTDANDEIDTELFEKALNLHEVKVKACMIPRTEIVSLDVNDSVEDLLTLFQSKQLSRLLVVDDDIDNVLGYVHHQQMLYEPKSIAKIIMDIPIIPETMRVRDLMDVFIKNNQSIAWVVNEFGGTAGLITFEDILEEIFGEIEDEHDIEEFIEEKISDTEYLFSGRLELDFLNERYPELQLPDGEYHTLSGYLVMTTESIPEEGDEIELGEYKFMVVLMSDTRIETVRVIKKPLEE
ncbi:MAG: putative hemolysin [Saprospiraceae bacterium]|jgi:putative hemolysin